MSHEVSIYPAVDAAGRPEYVAYLADDGNVAFSVRGPDPLIAASHLAARYADLPPEVVCPCCHDTIDDDAWDLGDRATWTCPIDGTRIDSPRLNHRSGS